MDKHKPVWGIECVKLIDAQGALIAFAFITTWDGKYDFKDILIEELE